MNSFPSSVYPPSGYNDNNFNRQSFPSNIFPPNGGMTGNPNGQFNPMSTNSQQLLRDQIPLSNFKNAFEPSVPIIEKIDYTNKNNVTHNNIGENVLDEHVVEYRLIIDSIDRDIKYYPNPFSYTVALNPIASSSVKHEEYIDFNDKSKGKKTIESRFDGAPAPHINKEFRNVKYVKLENVILPQYSGLKKNKKDGIYEFDKESHLLSNMYVSLDIRELDNERIYTTADSASRCHPNGSFYTPPTPFAIILPDKIIGLNYYAGTPYYGSKIYKNSLLGNLTKLTINFYDAFGVPLKYNDLATLDDLEQFEFDNGEKFPVTDLRHPYNKKIQNHISLIVGVVESQINTNTKFDY